MTTRREFTVLVVAAAVLLVAQTAGAQSAEKSGETYKARLSVVPIDVSMQSTIAGSGSLTATLAGKKLAITGSFEGLRSPATLAQIHRGPRGMRGPAVFDLVVTKATSGTVGGSVDLNPAQIEDLRNGRLYVQVHSEKAPDGNLRGWLLR